jgi:predicted kinase
VVRVIPHLIVVVGMPGCGKTTWAEEYAERMDADIEVISSDAKREEILERHPRLSKPGVLLARFWKMTPPPQDLAFAMWHTDIFRALRERKIVIADATNLQGFARDKLREIADLLEVGREARVWTNAATARERNRSRGSGLRVGDTSMASMEQQLVAAKASVEDEGYARIEWVSE